jgi:hypothetical protein
VFLDWLICFNNGGSYFFLGLHPPIVPLLPSSMQLVAVYGNHLTFF